MILQEQTLELVLFMKKLGIEKPSNNRGGNGGGARTLFDSNPGRQSNTDVNQMSSVEDIKGLL